MAAEQRDAAPLIAAQHITKRFGALAALSDVDLAVCSGEIHAILGENGAGKSTLMNVLSGLLRPTAGEVLVAGRSVRFASPTDAERRGIGMVHQHFLLVPSLTVAENLLLSAAPGLGGPLSYPLSRALAQSRSLADRLGWQVPWNEPAGRLPIGIQQRVEILKALRGDNKRILIFDEPTSVLTPTETPELFHTIRRLAAEGRAILFISHKLDEVLALAHNVTVLRHGAVVARLPTSGTSAGVLAAAMVGPTAGAALDFATSDGATEGSGSSWGMEDAGEFRIPLGPDESPASGTAPRAALEPTLIVERLTASAAKLREVSFTVAAGEIFGVAGVDGNGQGELADCLSGLARPVSGSVRVRGREIAGRRPAAFRRVGVALIPADRQARGLALPLSLTENFALGVIRDPAFRSGPFLRWPALRRRASDLIQQYDIRASGPESPVGSLSGGNQQKVVIARELSGNPAVIVAVNPTRGLDVGAIAYVHRTLRAARANGAAIVLISTELDEVRALATRRVAVLYEGRIVGVVSPGALPQTFGLLMGGKGASATAATTREATRT
jgi:simple sugar transport system ATP-binding protein